MKQKQKPFLLKPVGKDYLWGGLRLRDDYNKEDIVMEPLAETWECSTHPDGESIVGSGEHAGRKLTEVLRAHPEYLGTHPQMNPYFKEGDLPILIKLIDAKSDLSVQVHPDDDYANRYENGSLGKTEMWYVLDAAKDASLIYGFHHDMSKEQVKSGIEKGTIGKYLQKINVKKDDMFFVEAGTVHAIGAGALIAEIQENSNLTYRLYDYDRIDKNGEKRPLHVDKALDVMRLMKSEEPRQPMRVFRYQKGCASEFLCRCKYFQAERLLINTEICKDLANYQTDENSFHALLCTDGCGVMLFGEEALQFFKGDCIFVPAMSVAIKLHGKANFIKVLC